MRKFLTVALLMTLAVTARALDLKTIEGDYTYDLWFASFTNVTTKTADPAGLAGLGISTAGYNVVGFGYSIVALGADAVFTISHTTRTYHEKLFVAPVISTTPFVVVPSGRQVDGIFRALTVNPVFTFSSLTAAATYYIWVELGRMKRP